MRKLARLGKRLGISMFLIIGVLVLYRQKATHDMILRMANHRAQAQVDVVGGKVETADVEPPQRAMDVAALTPAQAAAAAAKNETPSLPNDYTFDEADMTDEHGNPYTIVIWRGLSGKPGYVANPEECLSNISCDITYAQTDLKRAHAVVFPAEAGGLGWPPVRFPWQHYVWWAQESPLHSGHGSNSPDHFYNLTFHYRTDAEVYAPYGSINLILRELTKAGETDLEALLEKKRGSDKMAAWAVSNCYQQRMNYAKSLMDAGLDVDTFGGCFGGRQIGQGKYSPSFYDALSRYKFYFSFENSISCKDYFTEKLWFNGLRSGAVPVVWGPRKEDLLKVAPSKSFIHSSDFKTPQEMVKYLQYLAGNETAYAEYLQWRTWIKHPERVEPHLTMASRDNDLRSFCKLCAIVQADGRRRKRGLPVVPRTIKSISEAWQGREGGRCHN